MRSAERWHCRLYLGWPVTTLQITLFYICGVVSCYCNGWRFIVTSSKWAWYGLRDSFSAQFWNIKHSPGQADGSWVRSTKLSTMELCWPHLLWPMIVDDRLCYKLTVHVCSNNRTRWWTWPSAFNIRFRLLITFGVQLCVLRDDRSGVMQRRAVHRRLVNFESPRSVYTAVK